MISVSVENPIKEIKVLSPSVRLLCGPGPGNAHPRVHSAMALPQLGHMDPEFLAIIDDLKVLLRYTFQTTNEFAIPIAGTGCAGWEAAVANLTEPGETHLVFVNGFFGERHCDMASRYGAIIERVDKPWGEVFSLSEIKEAIERTKPQLIWICHAETSTGALQPLEGIGEICKSKNCLFLLDAVTSLAGSPLNLDSLGVDVCYSGTQKCLSCPPGLSPLTLGTKALEKIQARSNKGQKVPNWYLDINMLANYLYDKSNSSRVYHHTAPISMVYALREALCVIAEEGIQNVWQRHQETSEFFWKLVEDSGLQMHIPNKSHRSHALHTIKVPDGVNAGVVIKKMMEKYHIEIGGGLGTQLAGKIWRVGLMGYNSRKEVALLVISALNDCLRECGWDKKKKQ